MTPQPPIIDSHCHAWPSWPYASAPPAGLADPIGALLKEMDRHGVPEAVVVCARLDGNDDNNAFVARAVARHADRLHMFADLDSRWLPEYHTTGAAKRLRRLADQYPLAGFTHYLRDVRDRWLVSEEGLALFAAAAERGLVASLSAAPGWQPDIRRLARAVPQLPVICHHLGWIRGKGTPVDAALADVLASAAVPNILIKVSGFHYGVASPRAVPDAETLRIVRALHGAFGARRLCWGSDWPVVLAHLTYGQALDQVRRHCDMFSGEDRDWILGGTLAAVMRRGTAVREVSGDPGQPSGE
jgi:predicted TIM-barrel fold metal-dependent hydrolase